MLNYAYPETLVDTQWLVEHLDDPNVRIIEMDLDRNSYDAGHLPGTIFWSVFAPLLSNFGTNFDPTVMEKLLSDSGITNDTTVIAVHGSSAATSGFIFWLLKILGHQDVRILNGGRPKWQQDGLPLTTESTVVTPTNYCIKAIDNTLKVSSAEVKKSIKQSDCAPRTARSNRILLDVRTPQEYQGEIYLQEPPQENERAGHIPGAINLDYELAHNEDGTFKSVSQLQKIYRDLGITPDKLIIPYCAVGGRSAHTWFILKYLLGYPQVKNYDGSWNEWSLLPDALIQT
ncbi:MAG: sulfurtransferase [Pleurocapsa sp. MO_192.B19]|nr:sulfurtransferase [Pleurocapsa sp. MO_192.B19]